MLAVLRTRYDAVARALMSGSSAALAAVDDMTLPGLLTGIVDLELSITEREALNRSLSRWVVLHIGAALVIYPLLALHIWDSDYDGLTWLRLGGRPYSTWRSARSASRSRCWYPSRWPVLARSHFRPRPRRPTPAHCRRGLPSLVHNARTAPPNQGIETENCVTCNIADAATLAKQSAAFHATVGECRGCHVEHQGLNTRPIQMNHSVHTKVFVKAAHAGAISR